MFCTVITCHLERLELPLERLGVDVEGALDAEDGEGGEGGHGGVVDEAAARRAREHEPVGRQRLGLERALALNRFKLTSIRIRLR